MIESVLCVGILVALWDGTAADECYNWYYDENYDCSFGCCGDGFDRGCCSLTAIIVGCVIGAIVLIAITVTVVCCCVKQKGRAGRTINAAPLAPTAPNVTVINPGQPYYMGQPPPPYGQYYTAPQPGPAPGTATGGPVAYPHSAPALYQDSTFPPSAPPAYKQ